MEARWSGAAFPFSPRGTLHPKTNKTQSLGKKKKSIPCLLWNLISYKNEEWHRTATAQKKCVLSILQGVWKKVIERETWLKWGSQKLNLKWTLKVEKSFLCGQRENFIPENLRGSRQKVWKRSEKSKVTEKRLCGVRRNKADASDRSQMCCKVIV